MGKNKITEDQGVVNLVRQAKAEYEKKQKEVLKQDEQNKEKIIALTKKEGELKERIETEEGQVDKMQSEYEELERKKVEANLAEIQESVYSKEDVKAGKISMAQFVQSGKRDEEIQRMAADKTLEELDTASNAIREKGVEIARLKVELHETQNSIFGMTLNPVKILRASFRELGDMLDFQLGPIISGWHSAKSNLEQAKHDLMIAEEGTGLSAGFKWDSLTLTQARRLIHDPKLPKEHIASLLSQLDDIEEGHLVSVTLHFEHSHWPGLPVEVHQELEFDETIKTSQVSKKKE